MITAEENIEPSQARLNALLRGFVSGHLNFWVAASNEKLLAFFITSKYVGGPAGSGILYVSYLRGIERIPPKAILSGLELVKSHAAELGCSIILASTASESLTKLALTSGAQCDTRIIWRV